MDAMRGDATLFTRNDEVEAQWRICDPIVQKWEATPGPLPQYQAGSQGPAEAEELLLPGHELARDLMPGVSRRRLEPREGTTPDAIEAALRELLNERHAENESLRPGARAEHGRVVDKAWSGEIANRLRSVGRYHASRTIVLASSPSARGSTRVATIASDDPPEGRASSRCCARRSSSTSATSTSPTWTRSSTRWWSPTCRRVLWSPHGHPEAVDVAAERSPRSSCWTRSTSPTSTTALERARELLARRPTSSTSRGCARRPGASASRRPSTPPTCAPTCATSARSPCATTRTPRPRRCCSSAGWPRAWAGSRRSSSPRNGSLAGKAHAQAPGRRPAAWSPSRARASAAWPA